MTRKTKFGRRMRNVHFQFAPEFTPLNHGSFGAYPRYIQEKQDEFTKLCHERPDTFIVYDLPNLIDRSRLAIAPMLGVPVDEVVFVPNATTGVNTVLRNLKFLEGDVVLHFSTIYDACEKTLASISDMMPLACDSILLEYPIQDEEIVRKLKERIAKLRGQGKTVRLCMFDTVLTFPGARLPWEALVRVCKEMDVLSLIDGAHGIGHIDLSHLGEVGPDFFVSNCYKWLYTPRGCAVLHVPVRNQHLIRTSFPTSHGYQSSRDPQPINKTPFVHLFEFVATIDYTPYLCVPDAIQFRQEICGGEAAIRTYCFELAKTGGQLVADSLGTEVMNIDSSSMTQCCFANVKLPFTFENQRPSMTKDWSRLIPQAEIGALQKWLNITAVKEYDTYLQIDFHSGFMWVRLSGQTYLGLEDFEWISPRLKTLCSRANQGEYKL
ncbi:DNA ligase 4 [Venturia nashicola]|uniref:DNA ligase 4 n=1 Tax=Venturia nashicola TaxID=86259 RepID=A0A4Z1P0A4_9PEZI|nr:DNA ligase 4 [Venturia nashicola]TLD32295.1 DNA ligase 4 [Venturia nashicola]